MKIVFLDTETTSLRHDRRAWEIGLIARDAEGKDTERSWLIDESDLDLGNADVMSLKIGKFYGRHPSGSVNELDPFGPGNTTAEVAALWEVEFLTRDAFIVGAVPWFDTDVLGQRMRANGICPSWNYHLVDVEALAAGALKLPPKWDFNAVLDAYSLKYDEADRHTALGDARMVRDLYDRILGAS